MRNFGVIFLTWVGGAICAVLLLSRFGDWLREVTPVHLQRPLWMTGMGFVFASTTVLLFFPKRLAGFSERQWVTLWASMTSVGVLLFAFYITGLDCEVIPGGRSSRLDCTYTEPP